MHYGVRTAWLMVLLVLTATACGPLGEPSSEDGRVMTQPAAPELSANVNANADIVHVKAVRAADGTWTFHVTVAHPDTGWEDYSDGWDVVTPDGRVLKTDPTSPFTRVLLHPHESEQPFTRSQSGILIPADVSEVLVRAHDLVDGFGGREVVVDLIESSGDRFEVVAP